MDLLRISDFSKLEFNSHENHNPDCDIVKYQLDKDCHITFGIYVKGPKKGMEFCEYYRGENYNPESSLRSYSRMYSIEDFSIPTRFFNEWFDMKEIYESGYFK